MRTPTLLATPRGFCLVLWLSVWFSRPGVADDRVLQLPQESVGVVTTSDWPGVDGPHLLFEHNAQRVQQAKGEVLVDEQKWIGLELSESGARDLSFLRQLPANSLHALRISNANLDREQLEHITQVASLRKLEFSQCQFPPEAFDNLSVLPQLLDLQSSTSGNIIEHPRSMAKWIGTLPKLQQLSCYPGLSRSEWEAVGAHPTLQSIVINVDHEAKDVLKCLSQMPNLRSLGLSVKPDADLEALFDLGNLSQLERLRWISGRVEGWVLRRLASLRRLEHLTLLHVGPGDDFGPSLETCSQLTHLEIVPGLDAEFAGLATHLARMPHLRHWPTLRLVDQDTLQTVVANPQIESLTLEFVRKGVTPDMLRKIGSLTNLKRLDLSNIPVRDDWLNCLTDLQKLEYLQLFNTGATGSGFSSLNGLQNLKEIHLWFGFQDDQIVQPDLSSLSGLPALEVIHIGGHSFQPEQIVPLGLCKKLKQIRLWDGGFTEDNVAILLSRLPELQQLLLSDNCAISDVGAQALAQHPKLQRLTVNGPISISGARELAAVPTLRELSISSSLLSETQVEELRRTAPGLRNLRVSPCNNTVVLGDDGALKLKEREITDSAIGKDGFIRKFTDDPQFRVRMDAFEGMPAPELGADFSWESVKGKVVLVEFWGTWCGPCRMQHPVLQDLYSKGHGRGLEIVGVHTEKWAEELPEYVKQKQIPWLNIVDADGKAAESWFIEHYPTFFLVDRNGNVTVASIHPIGLEKAVETILSQTQ